MLHLKFTPFPYLSTTTFYYYWRYEKIFLGVQADVGVCIAPKMEAWLSPWWPQAQHIPSQKMLAGVCWKCRVCQGHLHVMIRLEWSLTRSTLFLDSFSLSTFTFSQFTTSSLQTRYNIKMASNINVIFIYLCCPWIVEICKVAEDGAGYVMTKSDDLYMGSVTATLAHQVQTFCLLLTPSSCS